MPLSQRSRRSPIGRTIFANDNGMSINELTEAFGVSRQTVSGVLNGRHTLTADMAIRFENAFGVKAEALLRIQARYELAKAREHEGDLVVTLLIAAA